MRISDAAIEDLAAATSGSQYRVRMQLEELAQDPDVRRAARQRRSSGAPGINKAPISDFQELIAWERILAKTTKEERARFQELQVARFSPWAGRSGWAEERELPLLSRQVQRGGRVAEEPEEPGYELYNELVRIHHARAFRTANGEARVAIPRNDGMDVLNPESQEFSDRLGFQLFAQIGKRIPDRHLRVAARVFAGRAHARDLPKERVVKVGIRVVPLLPIGSRLDLCDDRQRCVRVDATGWVLESVGWPVFDRPGHLEELQEPLRGSPDLGLVDRLSELWRFVLLPPRDETADPRLLAVSVLVQFLLFPDSPKPVLVIVGEEGSGKTHAARWLQAVIDPSRSRTVRPPGGRDEDYLVTLALNRAVLNFDNISSIDHVLSDNLCRLSSGSGIVKRQLYADRAEVVFSATPLVILNGITATPRAQDLLRRSVFVEACRPAALGIEPRGDSDLEQDWKASSPRILGALLDLSVEAARILESGHKARADNSLPEYVRVGEAVAIALGGSAEDFDAAWRVNLEAQGSASAEDPWFHVFQRLADEAGSSERFLEPSKIADFVNEHYRTDFPHGVTGHQVGMAADRLRATLRRNDVEVTKKRVRGSPRWAFRTFPGNTLPPSPRRGLEAGFSDVKNPGGG